MAGCSGQISGTGDNEPSPEARMAAHAASMRYPSNMRPMTDWRAAALVDRRSGAIRVINFENRPIRDANIWVNQSFVHRVDSIPPNGYVVLSRGGFYDSAGNSLSNVNSSVTQVQIESGNNLYSLQGPVMMEQ